MAFVTSYENAKGFGIIPEGEYEVVVTKIEELTSSYGTSGIGFTLNIRGDVEQGSSGRNIFDTIWKRKNPTEMDSMVDGYSFKQLMNWAKACGIANNQKFESVYDLLEAMVNKCVRVTIEHNEYNGKKREQVKYVNPSSVPAPSISLNNLDGFEEIGNSDVPF